MDYNRFSTSKEICLGEAKEQLKLAKKQQMVNKVIKAGTIA